MAKPIETLILGASYGSLLAAKMQMAGHNTHLVCLPAEADLINGEGTRVRMPVKGREGLVEIDSRKLKGKLTASGPTNIDLGKYDLVALAMQEPQYRSDGVRQLLDAIGKAKKPCMSIMNMPPLPYLARIPGLDASKLTPCFTDASVWANCDPRFMTLCSPDPQAFRPPEEKVNVLQVRLPTNFKAARFQDDANTQILRTLEKDIDTARLEVGGQLLELPVKLKVHDSIFVPLAKWAMLMAGNYRCVLADTVRPIKDAVHSDLAETRAVYDYVVKLCVALGAAPADMVPFEKYANAALSLGSPSSAARALAAGAPNIERVDKLVQMAGAQKGMHLAAIDETVKRVDAWLVRNRAKA